jgi:hypothetical protein
MPAATMNITIEQGATYRKVLIWKTGTPETPVDLTDVTARAQIRAEIDADAVLLSMTTENGGITITPLAGQIELYISADDTAEISWASGVWDLELVLADGDVVRLVKGRVRVSREVTR